MEHDLDRWQRVDQLFHAALARQPSERKIFLENACAGDETLRREVESLLADEHGANAPTEIGHYRILDKLGEGGMGVVYIAEDHRLVRMRLIDAIGKVALVLQLIWHGGRVGLINSAEGEVRGAEKPGK